MKHGVDIVCDAFGETGHLSDFIGGGGFERFNGFEMLEDRPSAVFTNACDGIQPRCDGRFAAQRAMVRDREPVRFVAQALNQMQRV